MEEIFLHINTESILPSRKIHASLWKHETTNNVKDEGQEDKGAFQRRGEQAFPPAAPPGLFRGACLVSRSRRCVPSRPGVPVLLPLQGASSGTRNPPAPASAWLTPEDLSRLPQADTHASSSLGPWTRPVAPSQGLAGLSTPPPRGLDTGQGLGLRPRLRDGHYVPGPGQGPDRLCPLSSFLCGDAIVVPAL